jgi:hypothetical protein
VGAFVSVLCLAAVQQLQVVPYPAAVGATVTVTARTDAAPLSGVEVHVESPDGTVRSLGATDADGRCVCVPEAPGQYVYAVVVEGVRVLAPHRVVARRPRGWLALATVPLGLALLWRLSRVRGRRVP